MFAQRPGVLHAVPKMRLAGGGPGSVAKLRHWTRVIEKNAPE